MDPKGLTDPTDEFAEPNALARSSALSAEDIDRLMRDMDQD